LLRDFEKGHSARRHEKAADVIGVQMEKDQTVKLPKRDNGFFERARRRLSAINLEGGRSRSDIAPQPMTDL